MREEREIQARYRRTVQSQSVTKRPKFAESRAGGQKGCTCSKCGKGHEGPCRSETICYMCSKEAHMPKDCPQGILGLIQLQPDGSFEG